MIAEQPDTKGVDFADISAFSSGLFGEDVKVAKSGFDIGGLLKGILGNPQLLATIVAAIGGLFHHVDPTVPPPAPVPAPEPTPVPTPTPTPVPPPQTAARRVASLRSKWYFFEGFKAPNQHFILGKGAFDAIVQQQDPGGLIGLGYRLHIDITPVDQFGKPFLPGDPDTDKAVLLIDPGLGPVEGNNRIMHHLIVDGQDFASGDPDQTTNWDGQDVAGLSSEYDDYACTPVLAISHELPLSVERKITYYAVYVAPDGTQVTGPKLPTVRVKPWGL